MRWAKHISWQKSGVKTAPLFSSCLNTRISGGKNVVNGTQTNISLWKNFLCRITRSYVWPAFSIFIGKNEKRDQMGGCWFGTSHRTPSGLSFRSFRYLKSRSYIGTVMRWWKHILWQKSWREDCFVFSSLHDRNSGTKNVSNGTQTIFLPMNWRGKSFTSHNA